MTARGSCDFNIQSLATALGRQTGISADSTSHRASLFPSGTSLCLHTARSNPVTLHLRTL